MSAEPEGSRHCFSEQFSSVTKDFFPSHLVKHNPSQIKSAHPSASALGCWLCHGPACLWGGLESPSAPGVLQAPGRGSASGCSRHQAGDQKQSNLSSPTLRPKAPCDQGGPAAGESHHVAQPGPCGSGETCSEVPRPLCRHQAHTQRLFDLWTPWGLLGPPLSGLRPLLQCLL